MADLRPQDPRQVLEDAARKVSDFSAYRPNIFPTEIPNGDLPVWALDPREEELDHNSDSTDSSIYEAVPIVYIVYIGVASGADASVRSTAEATLRDLRGKYLTKMVNEVSTQTTNGAAEKTARTQDNIRQGESTVLVDAISLEFTQTQIYK